MRHLLNAALIIVAAFGLLVALNLIAFGQSNVHEYERTYYETPGVVATTVP